MNWLRSFCCCRRRAPPTRASHDTLFLFIVLLSAFFFLLIAALTGWFVWRYRRAREQAPTSMLTQHLALELTWTLIPLAIVMGIFFWGLNAVHAAPRWRRRRARNPGHRQEVDVAVRISDGTRTLNEVHVPVGKPVKLVMSSEDVIHSFFVPSMRLKQDVLPNRYTELWFTPTKTACTRSLRRILRQRRTPTCWPRSGSTTTRSIRSGWKRATNDAQDAAQGSRQAALRKPRLLHLPLDRRHARRRGRVFKGRLRPRQ